MSSFLGSKIKRLSDNSSARMNLNQIELQIDVWLKDALNFIRSMKPVWRHFKLSVEFWSYLLFVLSESHLYIPANEVK